MSKHKNNMGTKHKINNTTTYYDVEKLIKTKEQREIINYFVNTGYSLSKVIKKFWTPIISKYSKSKFLKLLQAQSVDGRKLFTGKL